MPLLDNAKLLLKVALGVLFAFGIIILGVSVSLNLARFQLLVLENKKNGLKCWCCWDTLKINYSFNP